jgi:hypothetical protein
MTEIKNTKVYGLKEAVKRSGYPMRWEEVEKFGEWTSEYDPFDRKIDWADKVSLDEQDKKRVFNLCKAPLNSGHPNFLSGITVQFDIKMPLYLLKQFQRYHFIQIISSQSTMHTITKREGINEFVNRYVDNVIIDRVNKYIGLYNSFEENKSTNIYHPGQAMFEEVFHLKKVPTITFENKAYTKYELFMRIVSNIPSGFEMWMGIATNYLQLATIYKQRKDHKLGEDWGVICSWIDGLPYFKEWGLTE